jgi:AraC-like DNA-binding protein
MTLPTDSPSEAHAFALQVLRRWLASPEDLVRRLFVPRPEGRMRHFPGKKLHILPELFLVLEGTNRIDFPAQQHDLGPGQLGLIPGGMPHSETFLRHGMRFQMLVVMLHPRQIRFLFADLTPDRDDTLRREGASDTAEAERIAEALEKVATLAHRPDPWSRAACRGLAYGSLAWIGLALRGRAGEVTPYSSCVSRAQNLIAHRLEDPGLGTGRLAAWIGCAPDYLSNAFHRETGFPLMRTIHRERIRKAEHLLAQSSMRVKEIAAVCGFRSGNYFGRLFRTWTGMTPRAYRQRHASRS